MKLAGPIFMGLIVMLIWCSNSIGQPSGRIGGVTPLGVTESSANVYPVGEVGNGAKSYLSGTNNSTEILSGVRSGGVVSLEEGATSTLGGIKSGGVVSLGGNATSMLGGVVSLDEDTTSAFGGVRNDGVVSLEEGATSTLGGAKSGGVVSLGGVTTATATLGGVKNGGVISLGGS